jgi:hypothetical protein
MRYHAGANLTVTEIRYEAHRPRGTLHNARSAERRRIETVNRTRQLAELIISPWGQPDRRQSAALITAGINSGLLLEYLLAAPRYRTELLPQAEWGRGLTRFMLDSGAYSAFKLGRSIDIEKYIQFLSDNPWIKLYVNLDVINPRDPNEAAYLSLANFETMCERGLSPMPVFHVREDFDYLRKYLALGCDYIGLSASSQSEKSDWDFYEKSFEIIQRTGQVVRVHAFGESASQRLKAFPFDSADSATWMLAALRYARTNISRLGHPDLTEQETGVARTYLEALRFHRLEQEIRLDRPDFDF